ncbi:MAG: hypothetical protein V1702_03090 [Candidatus Woesearchaeota archaeon]
MAKAQMDILNLVIATAVMVIISSIGLMWYSANSFDRSYTTSDAAFVASNLPEIKCSFKGASTTGCVDLLRVEKLGEGYYSSFGYSTISVYYVQDGLGKNLTLYENKKDFRRKKIAEIPVSVYDAEEGRYFAGKLRAEVYS